MHEYELVWVWKFLKGSEDLRSEMALFAQLRRNYLGQIIFFGNVHK
jgi:hypothetical protein